MLFSQYCVIATSFNPFGVLYLIDSMDSRETSGQIRIDRFTEEADKLFQERVAATKFRNKVK